LDLFWQSNTLKKMDLCKDVAVLLMAGAFILSAVSAQGDMTVTYMSEAWFPVDQNAMMSCQVEHTENRDSLSVFWSRQKSNSISFEKIGGYNSISKKWFIYRSAPADIAERFNLTENAFVGLTAKALINNITLNDAGTYQCEVEDDQDYMSKSTTFEINVYSLPSSVVVNDGNIELSMIPDVAEASAEGETQEAPEQEAIATCVVEGVYPKPTQVQFLNNANEVLSSIDDFEATTGDDGLMSFSVPLYLEASKSLDGTQISCKIIMVEDIPPQISSTKSSPITVYYPTENVEFSITESVVQGGEVVLSCQGDGNPAPLVTIEGPQGIVSGNSFVAEISHAGTYTCSVLKHIEISETATLAVYYLDAPSFDGESNINVIVGDDVMAYCEASGLPAPSVQWFGPDDGVVAYGGSLNFMAEKTSGGIYTCRASNEAGSQETSVSVAVQYGCSATLTKAVSYSTSGEGKGHVVLTCIAEGDPTCEVSISGLACDASGSGSATCTIPDMLPQKEAPKYTCTATNGVGPSSTSSVTIDEAPVCCIGDELVGEAGMPAGGIAAIIIVIALVVVGIPIACYYCRRSSTPSTKNAKAMEAGEDEKLADAENQE
jgi:hypothetical protein